MKTLKIGIDSGKSFTKWCVKDGAKYLTGEFPTHIEINENKKGEYELDWNNNRYIVGESTDLTSLEKNATSKQNETHKVCVLTAIATVIETLQIKEEVNAEITLNMPLTEFLSPVKRDNLISIYNQHYKVKLGNQYSTNQSDISFVISAKAYYEAMGAGLKYHDMIGGGQELIILDMGSLNNGCIFYKHNGRPEQDKSKTIKLGFDDLKTRIKYVLESEYDKSLTYSNIENVIAGRKVKGVGANHIQIVETMVRAHLSAIEAEFQKYGVFFDQTRLIVSGGATLVLGRYIKDVWGEDVIIHADSFTNAKYSLQLLD